MPLLSFRIVLAAATTTVTFSQLSVLLLHGTLVLASANFRSVAAARTFKFPAGSESVDINARANSVGGILGETSSFSSPLCSSLVRFLAN